MHTSNNFNIFPYSQPPVTFLYLKPITNHTQPTGPHFSANVSTEYPKHKVSSLGVSRLVVNNKMSIVIKVIC